MSRLGKPVRQIPATVVVLGMVSLLTDLASEMVYPLLPLLLVGGMGASAVAVGVIEGAADAVSSLLRLLSGLWSDRLRRRKPLVVAGYSLASLVRPLVGLASAWPQVLGLRLLDRVGKGLRGSPRDALIAEATPVESRGLAYGFHRSMDHAGAVIGPLVAVLLLGSFGLEMRQVFLLSAVPGLLVILLVIFAVREPRRAPAQAPSAGEAPPESVARRSLRELLRDPPLCRLLVAFGVFTLGNSTDAFLLLKLHEAGLAASWVALLWSLHHVFKMGAALLGGWLSDRWGRRRMMLLGWAVYAAVYAAFAFFTSLTALIATFLVYGLYFGLTEPVEKAWVADLAPRESRGAAFGAYHAIVGLAALPASLFFGLLWTKIGPAAAFLTGAALAALAVALLLRVPAMSEAAEVPR